MNPAPRSPNGAETALAAVIGSPIRHSLSPTIFNAAFDATDLDWVFVALEVDEASMPEAVAGIRALGIRGVSVTMPGKEAAAQLVDHLTPEAERLGAVNSIRLHDGRLIGHNTDGAGFVDALVEDQGFDPRGRRCAVLGAGGAARAVVAALAAAGASDVGVMGRTHSRVVRAVDLAGPCGHEAGPTEISDAELVVNATPVGMGEAHGELPLDANLLQPGQLVVDLVYHPLETALMRAARDQGATAANGVGMLVHQAGHQFRSWTGLDPPLDAMRSAVRAALA